MRKNNLGTYNLGSLYVTLYADDGLEGGNFDLENPPQITVGLGYKHWPTAVGILLHEAMEMSMVVHGCKMRRIPLVNYDTADCTFTMNHSDYGRICSEVGYFMAETLPALEKAFKKQRKGTK